eukprot:4383718-Prymnesium_polylepis.1
MLRPHAPPRGVATSSISRATSTRALSAAGGGAGGGAGDGAGGGVGMGGGAVVGAAGAISSIRGRGARALGADSLGAVGAA